MKIFAVVQKGIGHEESEDRVVVGKNLLAEGALYTQLSSGIVAVADGVGGHNAGAVASHYVARELTSAYNVSEEWFAEVNEELIGLSESYAGFSGMATTLSGIRFHREKSMLFSVGNTRVYEIREGKKLRQLTADDTELNDMLAAGEITPEEIEHYEGTNDLTAVFGGGHRELCRIRCGEYEPTGLPFLMTSDGIHDWLTDAGMEKILSEKGAGFDACEALIGAAREAGSVDDCSVILGYGR